MSHVVRLRAQNGLQVEFVDQIIGQGGMKDVYFSPDRSYVVAFYRSAQNPNQLQRLNDIVGLYRERMYEQSGADLWREVFCWPEAICEHGGRVGIVVPAYKKHFFFEHGSTNNDALGIRGKEKQGKWFTTATNRYKYLAPEERGNWLRYLQVCLDLARAVRRLHQAGLAHSDLSYKNVLVAPAGGPKGRACIIDLDGLVVPGKFPPEVVGTPDFIAPEVIATQRLASTDPKRRLPSRLTDQHALATLIYLYLLCRHPLRGAKVHDADPMRDEELQMGERALFIEHPTDASNRVNPGHLRTSDKPWGDPGSLPSTIVGPYLMDLFRAAFVQGLHNPEVRPTAGQWEMALIRTLDLIQPCRNKGCDMQWYAFDNQSKPVCGFCKTPHEGTLPVLNMYSRRGQDNYRFDEHRIMIWDGQSLYPWHVNRGVIPNEHLSEAMKKRVGYFQLFQGEWYFVNQGLPTMIDGASKQPYPIGSRVKLVDGTTIILDQADGGRLVRVQMAGG